MTAEQEQQAAALMRGEILGWCLWCGAPGLNSPTRWDPALTEQFGAGADWPPGMCHVCWEAKQAAAQ